MESDVRVFLFEHDFSCGKGNCFYYSTQDGLVSHPSASGEQGTWLFSVREALIMLVALLLRTVLPPDRYLRELQFGSSGKPLGFFGHLGRLYVSLHRFLFSARRICQILFVVGLNSKYWVLSSAQFRLCLVTPMYR